MSPRATPVGLVLEPLESRLLPAGAPWSVVVTESAPFFFTDSDGDAVSLSVTGQGQMVVTGTSDTPDGSDIDTVVVTLGLTDSRFLLEAAGPGDGVQVTGELMVDSALAELTVEGDVASLAVQANTAGTICITGALGKGVVRGDLHATLIATFLHGDLTIGDDIEWSGAVFLGTQTGGTITVFDKAKGDLVIVADAEGDILIGADVRGAFAIGGNATGTIFIGDDIDPTAAVSFGGSVAELLVGDDIKVGFDVAGDLAVLYVGETLFRAATVTVGGDLGSANFGVRLNGRLTAERLTGSLTTGWSLNGMFRVTSEEPCAAAITIGRDLRGTLDLAGSMTGAIVIGDDLEAEAALSVGGSIAQLSIADKVKADFTVKRDLGLFTVGHSVLRGVEIDVQGALGPTAIGVTLAGSITAEYLDGAFSTGGSLRGALVITGADEVTADITIGWDLAGILAIAGDVTGAVTIGDDVEWFATVAFEGSVNELGVVDDVKADIEVNGNLTVLVVGGGVRWSAAIDVAGDLEAAWIGDDLDGTLRAWNLTGSFTLDGSLVGTFELTDPWAAAGDITIDGHLWGGLLIAGSANGDIDINGDLWGDLVIWGSANGDIDINGFVFGEVVIDGDLEYLETYSDFIVEWPDWSVIDYFFGAWGWVGGSLTVGGDIGVLVQG